MAKVQAIHKRGKGKRGRGKGSSRLTAFPFSARNIVYNFHYYDPFSFTHQGASWGGPNVQFYRNVPYPSSPEGVAKILGQVADEPARLNLLRYGQERWNAERLDREIGMAAVWAERRGLLITCNEFGAYRRFADSADRARWIVDMRAALEKHGIGWTMWECRWFRSCK